VQMGVDPGRQRRSLQIHPRQRKPERQALHPAAGTRGHALGPLPAWVGRALSNEEAQQIVRMQSARFSCLVSRGCRRGDICSRM